MASSEVEICNSALVKVGADRIISLTDNNERARICNEQYAKMRDDLIRSHKWNFAMARTSLTSTGNTPSFDFDVEYQIPSDVLRIVGTNLVSSDEYKIEGDKLVSNSDSVKILYIKKITDVSLFPPDFVEALALKIAADIAYSITNSTTRVQQLEQKYEQKLRDARSMDAQEGSADRIIADEWINSRF